MPIQSSATTMTRKRTINHGVARYQPNVAGALVVRGSSATTPKVNAARPQAACAAINAVWSASVFTELSSVSLPAQILSF